MHLEKGDSEFLQHKDKHAIYDLENIGQDILFFQLTEFKGEDFSEMKSMKEAIKKDTSQGL